MTIDACCVRFPVCHDGGLFKCADFALVYSQLPPADIDRLDETVGNPWISLFMCYVNAEKERMSCHQGNHLTR